MTPAREPAIAYLQSRGSEGLRSPPISALSPPTVVTVSRAGDLIFNTRIRRPPVARVDGPPRSSSRRISDLSQLAAVDEYHLSIASSKGYMLSGGIIQVCFCQGPSERGRNCHVLSDDCDERRPVPTTTTGSMCIALFQEDIA
ncbi:uncharacterized protein LOC120640582 isoform X2 [Panicum virgatum]|uniref:uncharacterized protein LOC120640582 isoform X2 n=1 Tax=Panicum virgatum TaxID=38727 RepID=UPI0019D56672|nr:uncharacterized protein LOC120640582 isoform X2 [Panicum virgatum]